MNNSVQAEVQRLVFLLDVVTQASKHLQFTSERVFSRSLTLERVENLESTPEDAEQIEAFVSRFARLQDNLGAKLLPSYLQAVGERQNTLLGNLDKAERLGLIESADNWMTMRKLRNQMVHEYIQEPSILLDALNAGFTFVPQLISTSKKLQQAVNQFLARHQQGKA